MRNIITAIAVSLAFIYLVTVVQAQGPEHPGRYSLHEVQPGDTLWSITEQYLPNIDPRIAIEWICTANGLDSALIHQGDILNIPDPDGPLTEPLGPWYSNLEAAAAAERELQKLLQKGDSENDS